ncbi:MAG: glycosyltransferase [Planctomycetota bacterium]
MPSDFVVLIATAGRPTLLGRTLESIASCELPSNYRETIVIENGEQHGVEDVVKAAPSVLAARYLHDPVANKSSALNTALEFIGDAFIFFADDDIRLAPETLVAYEKASRDHTSGFMYGGPTEVDYEDRPEEWLRQYLPASARGWELTDDSMLERPCFLGFNWAAFRCDVVDAGGFDPNRGPGAPTMSTGQESEMQERLLAAGCKNVYVPEARVWHYVPKNRCSEEWLVKRSFRSGVSRGIQESGSGGLRVGRYPLWVIRRRITSRLRAFISFNPKARFLAAARRSYNRGLFEGFRQAEKLSQTSSETTPSPSPAVQVAAEPKE